jgi:hypothetical protein
VLGEKAPRIAAANIGGRFWIACGIELDAVPTDAFAAALDG